jgi:hypothetical protein
LLFFSTRFFFSQCSAFVCLFLFFVLLILFQLRKVTFHLSWRFCYCWFRCCCELDGRTCTRRLFAAAFATCRPALVHVYICVCVCVCACVCIHRCCVWLECFLFFFFFFFNFDFLALVRHERNTSGWSGRVLAHANIVSLSLYIFVSYQQPRSEQKKVKAKRHEPKNLISL